jgi:hypothetical protein
MARGGALNSDTKAEKFTPRRMFRAQNVKRESSLALAQRPKVRLTKRRNGHLLQGGDAVLEGRVRAKK